MSYGSSEELYDLGIALDKVIDEHNLPGGGTAIERFARIVDHLMLEVRIANLRRENAQLASQNGELTRARDALAATCKALEEERARLRIKLSEAD